MCGRDDPAADTLRLFASWLRDDQERKWLIILDNVDDATVLLGAPFASDVNATRPSKRLIDYLPVCSHGRLLVTSRTEVAARSIVDDKNVITIEPMSECHASALAETKLGSQSGSDGISELIRSLEYIPLAITQATAYIRQRTPRVTVRDYVEIVARTNAANRSILDRDEGDLRRDRDATNAIFLTLQISMQHIEETRSSASDLLSLMSCFDRQAIPENLLRNPVHYSQYSRCSSLSEDSDDCDDDDDVNVQIRNESDCESEGSIEEDFVDDVAMLRSYSFISTTADPKIFQMHRMVQIATQRWIVKNGRLQHWQFLFVHNLCDAFPPPDLSKMKLCSSLYPHAMVAVETELIEKFARERHLLLLCKAQIYASRQGNNDDALKLARKVYSISQTVVGPEHIFTCLWLCHLVAALSVCGHIEEATLNADLAVRLSFKVDGGIHETTVNAYLRLADMYSIQGHHKGAQDLRKISLKTHAMMCDQQRPLITTNTMLGVAYAHKELGMLMEAEKQVSRALAKLEGMDHDKRSDTLGIASSVALIRRDMGLHSESKEMILRDLDATSRILGESHFRTINDMAILTHVLFDEKSYGEAAVLLEQIIDRSKRAPAQSCLEILTCQMALAYTAFKHNRRREVKTLKESIASMMTNIWGRDGPHALRMFPHLQKLTSLLYGIEQRIESDGGDSDDNLRVDKSLKRTRCTSCGPSEPVDLQGIDRKRVCRP